MATLKDLLDSGMSRDEINALLSQGTMGTTGFDASTFNSERLNPNAYMPAPPQPQVEQAPLNMIRNNTTGREFAPTDIYGQPSQSQPAGPAIDYSSPIEIGGYGKGYRLKGDATRAVLANGQIVSMGRDTGAERARMKEDLGLDKIRAEIANMNKPYESAEDKALARETAKTKGEADRAKQAAGIPGTPEYKKIQADNDSIIKAKSAKENFDRHADAMIKNIDMIIGDGGEVKQHPGLKNAVGQWDTMYPDAMVFKPTLNARRLGEALLNKASVQGLTDIRQEGTAPGSITEKEWPIFQSQGEVMSMSQGEDQYIKALKDKRDLLVQGKSNVARNYNERVASRGGSQPASGAAAPAATDRGAVIEQNGTQYMVMSRNADGSAVIKDPKTGKTGIWRP